jgi:hypothetical protein
LKRLSLVAAILGLCALSVFSQAKAWQPAVSAKLPALSTPVGHAADGSVLYLVRTVKAGAASIGWFNAKTGAASIIGAAAAAAATAFDAYAGAGRWVDGSAEEGIPQDALDAGADAGAKTAPILRVSSGGWLLPAAWSPADNAAVTFIGGKRLLFDTFQVLVPDWAGVMEDTSIDDAFQGARDSDGAYLAPLRAHQGGGLQVGKFKTDSMEGYVAVGGKEKYVAGDESELFVGSGTWVPMKAALPLGAIPAGSEPDGGILYIIRAKVSGAEAIGQYSDRRREAKVTYGGAEVKVTTFDVLTYDTAAKVAESQQRLTGAAATAAAAAAAARFKMTPTNGAWKATGELSAKNTQAETGLLVATYTYDGVAGEIISLTAETTLQAAEPGLDLVPPTGDRVSVAPDDGDFSGMARTINTRLQVSGSYAVKVWSYGPLKSYDLSLQTLGQRFTGTLSATTPAGADKIPTVSTDVKLTSSANYAIVVSSPGFAADVDVIDKATRKSLGFTMVPFGDGVAYEAFVDVGATGSKVVTVNVKPSKPGATPKPAGTFTLSVSIAGPTVMDEGDH